jgi:hypothetical protein
MNDDGDRSACTAYLWLLDPDLNFDLELRTRPITVSKGKDRERIRGAFRCLGGKQQPGNDVDIYLSPLTLASVDISAGIQNYDVALQPGTKTLRHTSTHCPPRSATRTRCS